MYLEQLFDNVRKKSQQEMKQHLRSPCTECGFDRAHLLFLGFVKEGSARGEILLELRVRVFLTAVSAARRAAPGLLKRRSLVDTTNSTHRENKVCEWLQVANKPLFNCGEGLYVNRFNTQSFSTQINSVYNLKPVALTLLTVSMYQAWMKY